MLTGRDAEDLRHDALHRAAVFIGTQPRQASSLQGLAEHATAATPLECRFAPEIPTGTSAKFTCVLDDGHDVKVKYGRNPEIHAEVAATRLLSSLGFAADEVVIVRAVRCYGCPRYPFLTEKLLWMLSSEETLMRMAPANGYTDFEWVAVERKFPAPPVETPIQKGWAWWELAKLPPRSDLDALRLMAVFLAHWDNKAENQRLVCLDGGAAAPHGVCASPLVMMQDLGATFGPTKVNLARWRDLPIWSNRDECAVSMRALPADGATFPDVRVSEAGRQRLATALASLSDDDVRQLFVEARFPEYQSGTDDERDLREWTAAFHHRVDQILNAGPCQPVATGTERP